MTLEERLANAREAEDLFSHLPSSKRKYNKIIAEIAVKIKTERLKRGLSQKEFADFMKVTQGMVSRWESAEYNFSLKSIVEIFDKLGVNFGVSFDEETAKVKNTTSAYLAIYSNSLMIPQHNNICADIAKAG